MGTMLIKQVETWDLSKSHYPFIQVEIIYEYPITVKVTIYGFDGNSIIVPESIFSDEELQEKYFEEQSFIEPILRECKLIN